jgi:DNA-binding GntR family transcriptional regulator
VSRGLHSTTQVAESIGATTSMRVAADLRRRILMGEFAPGTRLKIDDLADVCKVSHMPVREALHELEREGVVEVIPHRGAVIRAVDARFVRNVYDLRAALEGMLTERCAENIDAGGIEQLIALVETFENTDAVSTPLILVRANRNLHDSINVHADNPDAVRVLGQGRLLIETLRARFGFGPRRFDAVVAEHRQLLKAITRRDIAKAGQLARAHCIKARDDLIAQM